MNIGRFMWGVFVAAIGIIFLGINFGWWSASVWDQLWAFWPLILIVVGVRLLFKSDWAFVFGTLAVVLLLVLALATDSRFSPERRTFSKSFSYSSEEKAEFSQDMAVELSETLHFDLPGHYEVAVNGSDDSRVAVTLNGPESVINALSLRRDGSRVVLSQSSLKTGFRLFDWNGGKVTGTITIPKAMALDMDLSGFSKITVTNSTAPLTVDASGASKINFVDSESKNATINLSGAGEVTLDSCSGEVSFEMSGAGKITARSCNATKMSIQTSGAGNVTVDSGTIVDFEAESSGAGKITVPKPTGKIEQDMSGASKIDYR